MAEQKVHVPVHADVDCVVVGGSSAAVAAAAAARRAGASVFLLSERPYLGEDIAGALRLWTDGDVPRSGLARRIFGDEAPTPMRVKYELEQELLDAGVPFLFGCYGCALLSDADGAPAGVLVGSRSRLFAIRAATVVDATHRARLARCAGIPFVAWPGGDVLVERTAIADLSARGDGIEAREERIRVPHVTGDRSEVAQAWRYRLRLRLAGGDAASCAALEQEAISRTWTWAESRGSDMAWYLPPDPVRPGAARLDAWHDDAALDAFRFLGGRLWIAGGCADLSRDAAEALLRPCTFLAFGERIGARIAAEAAGRATPAVAAVRWDCAADGAAESISLPSDPLDRDAEAPRLELDLAGVPALTRCDVLVLGGGTGGAPAGIGAARAGADTLVCEYLPGLGGVGTMGLIGRYYHGNRVGFTAEIDRGVCVMGPEGRFVSDHGTWNIEWKMEWYRSQLLRAGGRLWFGALGAAALVDGARVVGALVCTPHGCGLVRAHAVVDASGNADLAAAAGAECVAIGADHVAVQGSGLGPRRPGTSYRNTDWTFIDDADVVDSTHAMVAARHKFRNEFDLQQNLDTRQRRQIVGDFTLTPLDFLAERTYPDTICTAQSNFDTHGFTIHPVFTVKPPDKVSMRPHIPYRCLLPRGMEGVLVTGLGLSAHRDSLPPIRMQPDVQNHGYAAGVAAAMSARARCALRAIDLKALQRHLVAIGNLEPEVLEHRDSFPLPFEAIAAAVRDGTDTFLGIATIFAHAGQALPLLRDALAVCDDPHRRQRLALILGMLGDPVAGPVLAASLAGPWDEGWRFRGMGQFGASQSPQDAALVALATSGAPEAEATLLAKIRMTTEDDPLSHHRAIAEAAEILRRPAAAAPLAGLLARPGMRGHHLHDLAVARNTVPEHACDTTMREVTLRELHLARALYRCGDHGGVGEATLRCYAQDLRAHYARHARAVLREGAGTPAQETAGEAALAR